MKKWRRKEENLKFHYGFVIVFGGFIIMALLHSMLQTCFSLFLVPVTEGMGIARTQFSLCTSIVAIVMMIISPKMGKSTWGKAYPGSFYNLCSGDGNFLCNLWVCNTNMAYVY